MWRLRNKILGMNARSALFLRANKSKSRHVADEKLLTKETLAKNNIPTAKLLGIVRNRKEALIFQWENLPVSFVIKPNRGFGGEGILIVFNRLKNGLWLTTDKKQLSAGELTLHTLNILDGNFSLANTPDIALIEHRLSIDPLFKRFASEGIPDIRLIIFNNVPVMAMLRVPTKKSSGRANLAQGGVGVGINITTGLTTFAVVKSWLYEKEIDRHPDTNYQLRGVKIPYWNNILKTAILAVKAVGLTFAGVDISVDKKQGPTVLELNARPGLGIQVAALAPLRERLERLKGLKVNSIEHGVNIARELFTESDQMEAEVESITGRTIIGLIETVTVYGKNNISKKIRAKIDTGADTSSIDLTLAEELGFKDAIIFFQKFNIPNTLSVTEAEELKENIQHDVQKHPDISGVSVVRSSHGVSLRVRLALKVSLAGFPMNIEPTVFDRSHLQYQMLIGQFYLSHFLIDTTKVHLKKLLKPSI